MKAYCRPLFALLCTAASVFAGAALAQAPGPGAAARMKAVVYHEYGPPDVLRVEEIERPVPDDNQVLVKVRAASVNPLDWHYMRGTPYLVRIVDAGLFAPKSPRMGVDFAGTVEAVGRNVTKFKPGDEVFGGRHGAFAEYVCVREDGALAHKPANLTFEQAAAVPIAGVTALQGLRDKGRVQPGQKVLINGASGGVGTFAVQIARSFGAEVTGVCSTKNVDLVRSLGADRVIDYTREDFTRNGQRYDLILDMVGNHSLSELRGVLAPEGTLVQIGSAEKTLWLGFLVGVAKTALFSRFVSQDMGFMLARLDSGDLAALGDLMQAGKVTPVIDRHYRLSEAAEAIRYLEAGHARGKVVLTVGGDDDTSPAGGAPVPPSAGAMGPGLTALGFAVIVIGVPIVVALALNRRFQRRNPGKRPYRWGYCFSLGSLIGGVGLGFMLESGAGVMMACGLVYAALAWFFARRHRWAWIVLTILSFNPVAWIINAVYLWKRWAEDSVATPAA